ncbi:MAG TPA: hypothetical protein VGM07_14255 [Stellaceae bacterium]|jgi:hypothetical protein
MIAKRNISSVAVIGLAGAFVLLANLAPARADGLPGPSANQLPQLRIDTPPPDQVPAAPPAAAGTSGSNAYGAIGAGSFPRSFQIPGTSTSVRIGGSIDESVRSRLDH